MNGEKNSAYFNSNGKVNYLCFGDGPCISFNDQIDFNALQQFMELHGGKFMYGYISYDAKNAIEKLESNNEDHINAATMYFHVPETVVEIQKDSITFIQGIDTEQSRLEIREMLSEFSNTTIAPTQPFLPRISQKTYVNKVQNLQAHIQRGDIYEINFCQEYFSQNNVSLNAKRLYAKVNALTKAPFSVYLKHNNVHVMSGSPERFIQKKGNQLISQPIKGTAPRGTTETEDAKLKQQLKENPKEISENVMIVDLVRNDLSKIATKGSVNVDELFGIYTFPTVHQMISTISCTLKPNTTFSEIMQATYPMGSMTGAPKINAMKLSESHEAFKRGIYSGTIGYILPNGDFDFNVVIRSLIYNEENGYLSCGVGGAITIKSDPLLEYEECETKVRRLLNHVSQ